jgi:uncharacterized membrane protein YdbT with pleckstrin-like domain
MRQCTTVHSHVCSTHTHMNQKFFEKVHLEEEEEIQSVVRRHWFYLAQQSLFICVLMLLPAIAFYGARTFDLFATNTAHLYTPHLIFLYCFWLLINWMLLTLVWTDYYLDVWCITNRRIIKIDQVVLFRRRIGSFRLERIQDIKVEISGIIATFLDFGTIHIQTASADKEEFEGTYLPKPQEIKSQILESADALLDIQPL